MADTSLLDDVDDSTPIGACLHSWHQLFLGEVGALERVLADEVVLHSPVLFRPIHGKDTVLLYLTGAAMTFVGAAADGDGASADDPPPSAASAAGEWDGRFRYVRVLTGERDAVLEFETTMDGKYVNGVDMITCDDDGLIVDFKVMVRPQQAVEAVRQMMSAALDSLGGTD